MEILLDISLETYTTYYTQEILRSACASWGLKAELQIQKSSKRNCKFRLTTQRTFRRTAELIFVYKFSPFIWQYFIFIIAMC